MNKALDCPFCGTAAQESPSWGDHFGCSNASCGAYHANLELEQWNRRAPNSHHTLTLSVFEHVAEFHEKMGCPVTGKGPPMGLMPEALYRFRLNFMFEELREFIEAHTDRDLAKATDALVDLVYVAVGTAHFMGVPFDEAWVEVHRANMEKRPWREGDTTKPRNNLSTQYDTVKPIGWRPPDIEGVLSRFLLNRH